MSGATDETGWEGDWQAARERKFLLGIAATPAQRLAWLEEAILFAHRAGALRRRPDATGPELDENRTQLLESVQTGDERGSDGSKPSA